MSDDAEYWSEAEMRRYFEGPIFNATAGSLLTTKPRSQEQQWDDIAKAVKALRELQTFPQRPWEIVLPPWAANCCILGLVSVTKHSLPCAHVSKVKANGRYVQCCKCLETKFSDEVQLVNLHLLREWPRAKGNVKFPKEVP